MKLLLTLSILSIVLFARENPFFPLEGEDDSSLTSNVVEHFDALNRQRIILPDSARLLKKISLKYQNLDGSIDDIELSLNSSVDWHLPIIIYQGLAKEKASTIVKKKSSLKGEKRAKKESNKKSFSYKKIYSYKFVTFYQSDRFMQLKLQDKLLRKFMIVNPHRIVLDFKREALFLTKEKKLNSKYYKKIRLGNHDGYYRIVLELDGKYRYKMNKKPYGYLVEIY